MYRPELVSFSLSIVCVCRVHLGGGLERRVLAGAKTCERSQNNAPSHTRSGTRYVLRGAAQLATLVCFQPPLALPHLLRRLCSSVVGAAVAFLFGCA